jgi:hypothetical protein
MESDVKGEMNWRTQLLDRQWQPLTLSRLVIEIMDRRQKMLKQREAINTEAEAHDCYPMLSAQIQQFDQLLHFVRDAEMDAVNVDMCKLLDLEIPF